MYNVVNKLKFDTMFYSVMIIILMGRFIVYYVNRVDEGV